MSRRAASHACQPGTRLAPTRRKTIPRQRRPCRSLLHRLLSILPIAAGFLAGLVLDTAALARLMGASLSGQFGLVPRITALAVLLVCLSPLLRAGYRRLAAPPPASRRTTRPKTRRPKPAAEAPAATGRQPARNPEPEASNAPKPRRRPASAGASNPPAR